MIENIIDNRKKKYCVTSIDAVVEPCSNDNGIPGATKFPDEAEFTPTNYGDLNGVSVKEAVEWANTFEVPVTLYLYDHPMARVEVYSEAALRRALGRSGFEADTEPLEDEK